MADKSFLDWPFFEPRHKALAESADAWAGANVERLVAGQDMDSACKTLVAEMAAAGLLKHAVPAPYGGDAEHLDVRSLAVIRETLAYYHGLADMSFAMQGLGSNPVAAFGTKQQKDHVLPKVASGEWLAAFALSEPEAGSDVAALATTAERDGNGYVLNGEKIWITNGGVAGFYVVFARTGEADGAKGLSAFLVEADTPGLEIAERIAVIAPHPLARLRFADCRVDGDALIGAAGDGFAIAMSTLDIFRSTVGAAALGLARRALDETATHIKQRMVGGRALADLQIPQAMFADMALKVDAAALLVYRAAWTKDMGAARVTREASMAKLFATENAQGVIDMAVQLHGGLGVTVGHKVEELYREIRALRIYEGASEVQKVIIARQSLGA